MASYPRLSEESVYSTVAQGTEVIQSFILLSRDAHRLWEFELLESSSNKRTLRTRLCLWWLPASEVLEIRSPENTALPSLKISEIQRHLTRILVMDCAANVSPDELLESESEGETYIVVSYEGTSIHGREYCNLCKVRRGASVAPVFWSIDSTQLPRLHDVQVRDRAEHLLVNSWKLTESSTTGMFHVRPLELSSVLDFPGANQ
ncbi:uncharacterized protein BDV17DRAFT_28187 [Aspergillus undulatus]|uniref:uncharacterized protein n=1 Tax=Aspergillus undulatus TaxID=1810928 RepID=UPI003CCDCB96